MHLAANTGVQSSLTNPKMDFQINAFGLQSVEGARKCGEEFIFASSGAVLGEVAPPMHDTPTGPKSTWCHQTC